MADSFSVSRVFDAAPDRVFAAWTTPEEFAAWFGTDAVEVPLDSVSLDVRPGGAWRATMHVPEGPVINWTGEYTAVEAPTRLALTINDDPSREAGAPVEVVFDEFESGRTRMTLTQTTPEFTPEQVQATVAGYTEFFNTMARVIGVE